MNQEKHIGTIFKNLFDSNSMSKEMRKSIKPVGMLCLDTKKTYFIFNGLLYKPINGVAMGSPLAPSLANAFLSCHEKNWLNSCPQGFKQVCYRRYVDNIFVLFKSNDYLKYFQEFLNSCHINMSFSIETERQNKFYFLDIEVIRE